MIAFIGFEQFSLHAHAGPHPGMASGLIDPTYNQYNRNDSCGAAITPYYFLSEVHFYLSPRLVPVPSVE